MNKYIVTLIIINLFSFVSVSSSQTVCGSVFDEEGESLVGAVIHSVKTGVVTYTDNNGLFTIQIQDIENDTLFFSYLGMQPFLIPLKGQTEFHIKMQPDYLSMGEIVVIGYGTSKKRDITGAVSSVSGERLENGYATSLSQLMTGKLSGVKILSTEGSLDAETKITIRGGGSITQDNSPLYIIDGFPVDNIDDIPATEIQSIDVLKDASASSIYGARGANGVIIITTKKGTEGNLQVAYNSRFGFRHIAKKLQTLSVYDFVLLQYEQACFNSDNFTAFEKNYGVFEDLELYNLKDGTDWQEEIFGRNAFFTSQNISLKGGTKKFNYRLNYNFDDNNGIMLGNQSIRHYVGVNLNTNITERFRVEFLSGYTNKKVNGAGTSSEGTTTSSRLKNAVVYRPYEPSAFSLSEENDDLETLSSLYDPVKVTNDDYRKQVRNDFKLNLALNIAFLREKELVLRSELGTSLAFMEMCRAYGVSTSQARQYGGQPLASIKNWDSKKLRFANTLTYEKKLGHIHTLKSMVGQELIDENESYIYNEARYFPQYISPEQALGSMSLGTSQPVTTYESPADRLFSLFGRINYDYAGRYLLTFTYRADRSSKFALENQWGYFPSAALAWRLSEEKFMRDFFWLSNAKLRISYGESGNNRIDGELYRVLFEAGQSTESNVYFDEALQAYLKPRSTLTNPDLKWETTITRNIGLDIGLFKNKVEFTTEVYLNTTRDLLVESAIPAVTGYKTLMQNIGETSNRGIEFALRGLLVNTKDFSFSTGVNIAFNKNRIECLGKIKSSLISSGWAGSEISSDYLLKEGESVGCMWGYVTDGYYTVDDFDYNTDNSTYTLKSGVPDNSELLSSSTSFGPGFVRFKDLNGDGQITEDGDRQIIGNANPLHTGGFDVYCRYKNWDLSVNFYWSYGNDTYNANKIEFTTTNKYSYRNMTSEMSSGNRWTQIDGQGNIVTDPEQLAKLNENASIWSPVIGRYIFHSWAVEDGSFLRLNNITLGYSFPDEWLKKLNISRCRIFVSVDNVWCWTKYTGYDPEVDTRRSTPLTPGVDYSAYPRSRIYSAGINLNF